MKPLFIFFLFITIALNAQDKVYFLNGELKKGKILEINPDEIILETDGQTQTINKYEILLLEFKNGLVERITEPEKTVTVHSSGKNTKTKNAPPSNENLNLLSLNTLAFVNADISVFYERLTKEKKIGFGVMGAYNFNKYVLPFNIFIYQLSNAKKKMDAGIFINYYPRKFAEKNNFYYGVLFKYTSFDFSYLHEENIIIAGQPVTNVSYTPASGYQLATIFTIGTHYVLNRNLFMKTTYGLGGFILRGDYYDQYNYMINRDAKPGEVVDRHFLLKLYFALEIGYSF